MNFGRLTPILKSLKRRVRDPLQLRFFLGGGMLAGWCVLSYAPLSEAIEQAKRDRHLAEAHLVLARDVEALRAQSARLKPRLPTGTDPNEWVEYFLSGVRTTLARLLKLAPQALRKQGPYDVVVVRIEVQGTYGDLCALVSWIETNERLLRIDSMNIQPTRGAGRDLVLSLTVLGVMG